MQITIVGGGLFGVAAARTLARRGHGVTLLEASTLPGERAASRDISKALRRSYGVETTRWAPRVRAALAAWRDLERLHRVPLFRRTGFIALAPTFRAGTFEWETATRLMSLAEPVEVLSPAIAAARFPGFAFAGIEAAVLDRSGGWLDPVRCVLALAQDARSAGARLVENTPVRDLASIECDALLVTAGGWLPALTRELPFEVRVTRQNEFLFEPRAGGEDAAATLPVWCCDIAGAGHYGFGPHPSGLFKVATHAIGPSLGPDGPDGARGPTVGEIAAIESFVATRLPCLEPKVVDTLACQYAMSPDGNFLFDSLPRPTTARAPLWFAAGCGSGHAFKFGPLLGEWAADLVEGANVPAEFRFARAIGERVV